MTPSLHWPRRHPYTKRYLQLSTGRTLTAERIARVARMVIEWEPRLFAVGVNVPECLLTEQRRLAGIVARGSVDWAMFPEWAQRTRRLS